MSLTIPPEVQNLERLVDELNGFAVRFVGQTVCENPFPYLRDMALIDMDRIRATGQQLWGTSAEHSGTAKALEDLATTLRESSLTSVQDTWTGPAYEDFDAHLRRITDAMHDEALAMPLVGDALVDIADAFETSWLEIITWALAVAGLVGAVLGFLVGVASQGVRPEYRRSDLGRGGPERPEPS